MCDYLKVDSLSDLIKINLNGHPFNWCLEGYTRRHFELFEDAQIDYILKNYKENFAFAIKYQGNEFTIMLSQNESYVRNNANYQYEYPKCPPPVNSVYCLKSNNINEVYNFIINK